MARFGLPDISMPVIRRYARQVAERFKPNKIILFGSFAYGEPNEHSDVDLLVVMPCPNETTQAVRIRMALEAPFPLDLVVRTPKRLQRRIKECNWFLREITEKGVVLYENGDRQVVAKAETDLRVAKGLLASKPPAYDVLCYLCQQSAEKFLKALLQESGFTIPHTHDLDRLRMLTNDSTLRNLRRGLMFLTTFAVDVRYPEKDDTLRQSKGLIAFALKSGSD